MNEAYTAPENKLITIENKYIKAGFLTDVGGRMVFLSYKNSDNLLYSDSTLWNEAKSERIPLSADAPFKAYNGFITWVGPQSEWWTQQDILLQKKSDADMWPPDPYIIYSDFEIVEKTDTSIVLENDASPVSGIKLRKQFILTDNKIEIKVSGTNCRTTPVSWDLWSNIRFDPFTIFKIPVDQNSTIKIDTTSNQFLETIDSRIQNGYFTFLPKQPKNNPGKRMAKAYIYPAKGNIIAHIHNVQLSVVFEKIAQSRIHPKQALIEVYNCVATNPESNLLELEHHSEYKTLKPNESIELNESWIITELK